MDFNDPVETILRLFQERGDSAYIGEPISQTEHALQTAVLAERAGHSPELIVAALLHDVGHLLHDYAEDCADEGIDDSHEELGSRWLESRFEPGVSEPVRLHVQAKRYLCSIDPSYLAQLSQASQKSLNLQGGPFSEEQVEAFRQHPHFESAVILRRLDDEAKIPGLVTPGLDHYRTLLETFLVRK